MDLPYGVTATVSRPGGEDQHGNSLPGTTHTVAGCGPAPAGSLEVHHLAATVEWDLDLLAPYGSDFKASDVVTLPGYVDPDGVLSRFQVHGQPSSWRNPLTGWEAGLVVRLKAVAG